MRSVVKEEKKEKVDDSDQFDEGRKDIQAFEEYVPKHFIYKEEW